MLDEDLASDYIVLAETGDLVSAALSLLSTPDLRADLENRALRFMYEDQLTARFSPSFQPRATSLSMLADAVNHLAGAPSLSLSYPYLPLPISTVSLPLQRSCGSLYPLFHA